MAHLFTDEVDLYTGQQLIQCRQNLCSATVHAISFEKIVMSSRYDVCIIGAGLVGLSVGRALAEAYPGISQVILDKENDVATHQSRHNSGVVHSGLYYRPGSLKARLCVEGRLELARFCEEQGVPFRQAGKLVIATKPSELEPLGAGSTKSKERDPSAQPERPAARKSKKPQKRVKRVKEAALEGYLVVEVVALETASRIASP